jgi:hypothetical protein
VPITMPMQVAGTHGLPMPKKKYITCIKL